MLYGHRADGCQTYGFHGHSTINVHHDAIHAILEVLPRGIDIVVVGLWHQRHSAGAAVGDGRHSG